VCKGYDILPYADKPQSDYPIRDVFDFIYWAGNEAKSLQNCICKNRRAVHRKGQWFHILFSFEGARILFNTHTHLFKFNTHICLKCKL